MPDRDPIRELESFSLGGAPVDTLPPAEVRRRGDRMRRRRTAALAGGSALAVALVVAAPFALAGGGGDRDSREPGFATDRPTASASGRADAGWRSVVPSSFDLAAGYPDRNEDGSEVVVDRIISGSTFAMCGKDVPTADGRVDEAVVKYSAPEDQRMRVLQVYANDRAAEQALGNLRTAVEACRSETIGGSETLQTPLAWEAGESSFAWTERYRTNGSFDTGLTVHHAVRIGNALLVADRYGEGGGSAESIWRAEHEADDDTQLVVDNMRIFAEDGGIGPGTEPAPGPEIPPGFPLDRGLTSPEGDPVQGPSGDAQGVPEATLCGAVAWPSGSGARLAATATGPELQESRELVRYPDAQAAVEVMATMRDAVNACPSEETEDGSARKVYRYLDRDTGYETVTITMTYDEGLGGAVWQFTRVGSGVLGVYRSGELSSDTVEAVADEVQAVTTDLTPEMCTFTEAGC